MTAENTPTANSKVVRKRTLLVDAELLQGALAHHFF